MGIELILKIAGIGILVSVISSLLKQTGRDEIAMIATIAGLVVVLAMVIDVIGQLFESIKNVFSLY